MEIGAGGVSGASDLADLLSSRDASTFRHQIARVMPVNCCVLVVMTNDHGIAVAVESSGKDHDAAISGENRSADRCSDIDAAVHRSIADSESRRHHSILYGP